MARRKGAAWFLVFAGVLVSASPSVAGDYNLFNPTPASQMRDFNPDRPSITTGPFTIDPGHVQTESDIVNFSKSNPDPDGTVTKTALYGSTNVRIGVTSDLEVDLQVQPYDTVRTITANPAGRTWAAGVDTLQLRAKYNFYGNDTYKNPGSTSLGVVPFVNIPTANNGVSQRDVDGGLIVPFALKLSDKSDLNVMTEFDYIKNDITSGYHVEYVNAGSLAYQLTDKLGTYIELATRLGLEDSSTAAVVVGGGLVYKLSDNLQIDVAVNHGLTHTADRINFLTGISRRY